MPSAARGNIPLTGVDFAVAVGDGTGVTEGTGVVVGTMVGPPMRGPWKI
jgi:hypothetical protein